jgi:two-component system invasion response regulator UvrY
MLNKIPVVIIDDHHVICAGLRSIIDSQPDMRVVAEALTGRKGLAAIQEHQPKLALLDLQLGGDMSGLDVLRSLQTHQSTTRVLMLSAYSEAQYGLNVLRAGAAGFIAKGVEPAELLRAMRMVIRGGRYLGPALAEQLVASASGEDPHGPLHSRLSAREFQIFCKLAQGESVSQVAAKMFLSVKTVSTYRRRVLDKMAMKSNADLTAYALRNELIQ